MSPCVSSLKVRKLQTQIFDVLFAADGQLAQFGDRIIFRERSFFDAGGVLSDLDLAMTATFDFLCTFVTGHGNTSKVKIECIVDEMNLIDLILTLILPEKIFSSMGDLHILSKKIEYTENANCPFSTLDAFSCSHAEFHDSGQHIVAFQAQTVAQTDQRVMVFRKDLVVPADGTDAVIHPQRVGERQERTFQRRLHQFAVSAARREHDREVAQTDGRMETREFRIRVHLLHRLVETLEIVFRVRSDRRDARVEDAVCRRDPRLMRFPKHELGRVESLLDRMARII